MDQTVELLQKSSVLCPIYPRLCHDLRLPSGKLTVAEENHHFLVAKSPVFSCLNGHMVFFGYGCYRHSEELSADQVLGAAQQRVFVGAAQRTLRGRAAAPVPGRSRVVRFDDPEISGKTMGKHRKTIGNHQENR